MRIKGCPSCGTVPTLPTEVGSQYELDCRWCGRFSVSVQICDLMTQEEREANMKRFETSKESGITNYYADEYIERAKKQALEEWNTRYVEPVKLTFIQVKAIKKFIYHQTYAAAVDLDGPDDGYLLRSELDEYLPKAIEEILNEKH